MVAAEVSLRLPESPRVTYAVAFTKHRKVVAAHSGELVWLQTPEECAYRAKDGQIVAERNDGGGCLIPAGTTLDPLAVTSLQAACDWADGNLLTHSRQDEVVIDSESWGELVVHLDPVLRVPVRIKRGSEPLMEVTRLAVVTRDDASFESLAWQAPREGWPWA